MKHMIRRILALLCTVTLIFALAACSGSKDKKDSGKDTAENNSSENESEEKPDGEVTGKFASIQDFIDSDLFRKHLEPKIADFEDKGLAMSFEAEDNKLIWNFKITDSNLSGAMDPSSLESALDSQASAFESVADILVNAVDVDSPVVLVRYLDDKGTELASKEFSATEVLTSKDSDSADPDASSDASAAE